MGVEISDDESALSWEGAAAEVVHEGVILLQWAPPTMRVRYSELGQDAWLGSAVRGVGQVQDGPAVPNANSLF